MRLFKRPKSNYWQYEIKGPNGKIRKSTGTTLKKEAKRIAEYHNQQVYKQIYFGAKSTVTLHQAVDLFLKEQQLNTKQTYEHYKHMSNILIKLFGPLKELNTINTIDIKRIQQTSHYAPKTINHILGTLNSLRLKCDDWNVEAPRFQYKKLKVINKLRYITQKEEQLLFKKLTTTEQKDICVCLLDTGMRISELINLHHSDIDLKNNVINIYRTKTSNAGSVGITLRMFPIIKRRLQNGSAYLFPSTININKPRTRTTKSIRRAINAAGLNSEELVKRYGVCTVHSFRDTFATRLVKAGLSLYKVQVMLGHSSPTMTQKYAHLSSQDVYTEVTSVLNVDTLSIEK